MDNLDDLMHQQVLRLLEKPELTASEMEVCRKYLNDRGGRGGKHYTSGYQPEPVQTEWDDITFDEVKVLNEEPVND